MQSKMTGRNNKQHPQLRKCESLGHGIVIDCDNSESASVTNGGASFYDELSYSERQVVKFFRRSCTTNDKMKSSSFPKRSATSSTTSSTCSSSSSDSSSVDSASTTPAKPPSEVDIQKRKSCSRSTDNNPLVTSLTDNIKKSICASNIDDRAKVKEYWETTVGPNSVEEALKVYYSMLHDDDQQLIRILKARDNNIPAATDLFLEQVRFRTRWQPYKITPETIPNSLPSGAWRLCGYSREGHIISNYKLQCWNPDAYGDQSTEEQLRAAIDEYVRYCIYMTELMIKNMKAGGDRPQKFILLFDLKGFTIRLAFRKNVRMMIVKLIYVAQSQYPERMHKVYLMNAPYGFPSAWKAINKLLDANTREKINFLNLNCESDRNKIMEDISPDVLGEEYGGNHPEYPIPC